jgi:hypothetical protein
MVELVNENLLLHQKPFAHRTNATFYHVVPVTSLSLVEERTSERQTPQPITKKTEMQTLWKHCNKTISIFKL